MAQPEEKRAKREDAHELFRAFGIYGFEKTPSLKVNYGKEFEQDQLTTPTEVKDFPKLDTSLFKTDGLYTLALIDPDAPSPSDPKFGCWMHYWSYNIKGSDIGSGQVLAEFVPSGPGEGSGVHTYVWLLYEQSKELQTVSFKGENHIPVNAGFPPRRNMRPAELFQGLDCAFTPIAHSVYRCEYDAHCEVVKKMVLGN
eukprot:TRINITY_DN27780_c0_g1_i1.p1 TRINITY_DN27780_c0_g1~~TRINITY_DN27780_c0_g1_i1.p1  ORF type:complete len:198 (+),score=20.69 TRINITY_DN27780_c0_g1_i1:3-596(+)